MSHCTSFTMTFNDKRILYRSMRELQMHPQNRVWIEYRSEFTKKLGIGGDIIGKVLTGFKDGMHIFFAETDGKLQPYVESSILSSSELELEGEKLLYELRSTYLKNTVESLADQIRRSGNYTSIREEKHENGISYMISLGDPGKNIQIKMNAEGEIEENVTGVRGRSCIEVTAGLEAKLQNTVFPSQRQWTHEYNKTVEDRQIQILRLNQ